jgi:hypothetical protein
MTETELIYETTLDVAGEIAAGRTKAREKHGESSIEAVPGSDYGKWLAILGEEFGEVCSALTYDKDSDNLRAELIDVATVTVAWIAALDKGFWDE